jgi:hypothetical protein
VPREDPREQAHERPRVPGVDRLGRRAQPAQPPTLHDELVDVRLVDLDAERAHRVHGRLGVARPPEALHVHRAVRDRPEQHRAVRDRLVAGHDDVALERAGRCDLHSATTGETTTP